MPKYKHPLELALLDIHTLACVNVPVVVVATCGKSMFVTGAAEASVFELPEVTPHPVDAALDLSVLMRV